MTRIPALRQLGIAILFILTMTSVADAGGAVRELQMTVSPFVNPVQCRVIAYKRLKRTLLKDMISNASIQKAMAASRMPSQRCIALAAGATSVKMVNETCRGDVCRFQAEVEGNPAEILTIVNEIDKDERRSAALEYASRRTEVLLSELDELQRVAASPQGNDKTISRIREAVQELASFDRLEAGIMFQTQGNVRQALESFSQSIQAYPKQGPTYLQRAYLYGMMGKCEDAVKDFDKALELEPVNAAANMGRGTAHACLGHFDQAIADYEQAIVLTPLNPEAYYQKALALAAAGDFRRAIKHYDRVVEIKPSYAMAYLKRAAAHEAVGDYREAISDYTKAIDKDLDFSMVYVKRGLVFRRLHEYEKAKRDFDKAVELNPANPGIALLREKSVDEPEMRDASRQDLGTVAGYRDSAHLTEKSGYQGLTEDAVPERSISQVAAAGYRLRHNASDASRGALQPERKDSQDAVQGTVSTRRSRGPLLPPSGRQTGGLMNGSDEGAAGLYSAVSGKRSSREGMTAVKKTRLVTIQVMSATDREKTVRLAKYLEKSGYPDVVVVKAGDWYTLRVGKYTGRQEAETDLGALQDVSNDAFLLICSAASEYDVVYSGTEKRQGRGEDAEVAHAPRSPSMSESVDKHHMAAGVKSDLARQRLDRDEKRAFTYLPIPSDDVRTVSVMTDGDGGLQTIEFARAEKELRRKGEPLILYARSETGTVSDVPGPPERTSPDQPAPDSRTLAAGEKKVVPDPNMDGEDASPQTMLPVTFSGILQDPFGKPLPGATIERVDDPSQRSISGTGGRFSFTGLPGDSNYLLKVELAGYLPVYISGLRYPPSISGTPSFTLYPLAPVPAEKTKQPVVVEADNLRYERDTDTYYAQGRVVISYAGDPGGVLTADEASLSQSTNQAEATGNVVAKSGKDAVYGDRIVMDIDTKEGSIYNGKMFISQNHFYVKGDRIDKRGDATYHVENASATTCDGEIPDWRILGKELDITIDGYGTIKHSRFLAKDFPVVYTPYFVFPAKTTRQSGFLVPYMSYSQDKLGVDVEVPFYWAISQNTDATFYQRYMSQRGFKEGVEFRYSLNSDHYGTFYADFLNDNKRLVGTNGSISRDWQPGVNRWSVYLNHISNISPGFYLRSDIAKVSDNWYFKDFSSHNYYLSNYSKTQDEKFRQVSFLGDESIGSLDSTVRLVKDWESYNLTALVKYTDDFTKQSNDTTLQKYPEVTLTGVKQSILGSPVYYEMSGVYGYYYRIQGQRGQLFDLKPTFSLPFNIGTALQVTPTAGWQGSFWDRDDSQIDTGNRHGNRQLFNVGGTMTTEVQRIFNVGGEGVDKIRHSIKPEVTYTYIPYVEQGDMPDYVTTVDEQNAVTYSLTNTLTARIKDKTGNSSYLEYLRLKLYQTFDIREARRNVGTLEKDRRPFSEVNMELDMNPMSFLSFAARNKFDVNSGAWTRTNYDLSLSDRRGDKAVIGYRYTQDLLREINLTLKGVINKNWEVSYIMRRNEEVQKNTENTFGLSYRRQCWSVQVSYSDKLSYDSDGIEHPDRVFAIFVSFYGLGGVGN